MPSVDADERATILAALLHDIGKLAQRARVPLGEGYRGFDFTVYGRHGAHALHSAQFVERELAPELRGCLAPILYHHNPQDPVSRIVAAADRLSAAERLADPAEERVYQPLANVFATVFAGAGASPPSFFLLRPLDPADPGSFFPASGTWEPTTQERDYAVLWQGFLAEHRQLDQSDFSKYLPGLYSLLQRHTWCVPSAAYRTVPDVSLFDHARTTSAIAVALRAYLAERASSPGAVDPLQLGDEACFRLAVGDLSGIQSYLYGIADTGAGGVARRLRARSLFLQMIAEVAAHQVLGAAGLPFLNALLASGGRFYLLLPNTPRAREAVAKVQVEADRWLLREFGGELVLNLASVELAGAGFEVGQGESSFGTALERAGEELARRKGARLREVLQERGSWREAAFVLEGFGGAPACAGCGKQPRAPGAELCAHCQTDWEIGRKLPEADRLALFTEERPGAIRALGHSVEVVRRGEAPEGRPYLVLALGDYDARQAARDPLLARPICNYVPTWTERDLAARPPLDPEGARPGGLVTFEDLASRAEGRPLLGCLKADVDRLGETFVFGLKPGRDSPARLGQMSRMLDSFFSGWLPSLLRADFPDCYSVYAGGDDLLLVGPWDQTVELAARLAADFARLTQNPKLHLSAGIFVAKPGYPIARAADGADDALKRAKGAGRARLSLLGHTLTWEEWRLVRAKWHELREEARKVTSAFLYHLLAYGRLWQRYAEWEKDHSRGSVLGLRYQPLLAYDLGRNLDRRATPSLYAFAESLLSLRPGDAEQRTILDNLGLLAQLWVLGRAREGGEVSHHPSPSPPTAEARGGQRAG